MEIFRPLGVALERPVRVIAAEEGGVIFVRSVQDDWVLGFRSHCSLTCRAREMALNHEETVEHPQHRDDDQDVTYT